MKIFLILILLNVVVIPCDPQCKTCQTESPYTCTSCSKDIPLKIYLKSCQGQERSALFLVIAILVIIVHLIMIMLGHGVYRNLYENIQLVSIISWGYGSQNGIEQLQATNFGFLKNNLFLESYGAQFFISVTIIGIFILLSGAVDRLPFNSLATMIKRKKIIFPLRIQTMIFNMSLFSALSQACTIGVTNKSSQILQIIVSIVALIKQFSLLLIIGYLSNFISFQIDDQHYYVLVEKLSTCRWYVRNNLLFSLVVRAAMITIFVGLFDQPQVAGLIITIIMVVYTLVSAFTLKYVKTRYLIFNTFGNSLTCACLFCMYGCGSQTIGSGKWQQYRKAYYALTIILCACFMLGNVIQMIANSSQISKQLRSIYFRFIICDKMDDAVTLNKYDSDKYRQKVISFRTNLIYNKTIQQRDEQQLQSRV